MTVARGAGAPGQDLRDVLRIPAFRRLWLSLSLSSLGDWLGLLATTALAGSLAAQAGGNFAAVNFAVAGVFLLRLVPAILIGPFAGVVADRLDRRRTMVVTDVLRGLLFLSIPVVGELWWLFVASLLIEVATQFWAPAKDATVPNLVPRERLEQANQLSLVTTYGSAPVAAILFSGLALVSSVLGVGFEFFRDNQVDLALYINGVTFFVAAATIWRLDEIPSGPAYRVAEGEQPPTLWQTITSGWAFIGKTPMVRGLVVGMLGAFAAGGAVVGLARTYVNGLGGGAPGYGLLFGTVFVGLAVGMFFGPRLLAGLSRRRLFAMAISGAGVVLMLLALVQNMVLATLVTLMLGACTGIAWVTGYTLLGLEVSDDLRGRTFAFVQSMMRIVLVAVLPAAPLLAVALGPVGFSLTSGVSVSYNGASVTFFIAGLLAAALGIASFRQMDDRPGVPLLRDLIAVWRGTPLVAVEQPSGGFLVAFEGGDGAGKSTQVSLLGAWLRARGHCVVLTREPGATAAGQRIRAVLLDSVPGEEPSARAEALLYAADRADHVHRVIRPALERGAVVVTDRYSDSSVAYQGAGRVLAAEDVTRLSQWASDGLVPDLTVVLDMPPALALRRSGEPADRLESEPLDFHERVRREFVALARGEPGRYLVVDATLPRERIATIVRERLEPVLPPAPQDARADLAEATAAPDRTDPGRKDADRADPVREEANPDRALPTQGEAPARDLETRELEIADDAGRRRR